MRLMNVYLSKWLMIFKLLHKRKVTIKKSNLIKNKTFRISNTSITKRKDHLKKHSLNKKNLTLKY